MSGYTAGFTFAGMSLDLCRLRTFHVRSASPIAKIYAYERAAQHRRDVPVRWLLGSADAFVRPRIFGIVGPNNLIGTAYDCDQYGMTLLIQTVCQERDSMTQLSRRHVALLFFKCASRLS